MITKPLFIILTFSFSIMNFSGFTQEVRIGKQVWATKNLDVSSFRNGDIIPEAKSAEDWYKYEKEKIPAWCYYNNDSTNGSKYGKLYNWYAVNDKRGLAPKGWHVPSDAEWATLINYSGGKEIAALTIKSKSEWRSTNGKSGIGTNKSGFNALPAGARTTNGIFWGKGKTTFWWSSTKHEGGLAWLISIKSDSNQTFRQRTECGLSVRLVKDAIVK